MTKDRKISVSAILLGLSIAVGPAIGGYLIGKAIEKFKFSDRVVTAKGLVEREVKADFAIWKINYIVNEDDLNLLSQKISEQQKLIIDFLKNKEVNEQDIKINPSSVQDAMSQQYASNDAHKKRFVAECWITVQTDNVELIEKISHETDELIKAGIVFRSDQYQTAPRYIFRKLNDLKPEMLAEAITNARKSAEKLIESSGSKVGSIRTAHQGQFNIYGNELTDQSDFGSYSNQGSINKIVRVVSTVVFNLVD